MPYSVQADLERAAGGLDKLIELCDRNVTGELNAAATTVMDAAIADADSWIDGFLQRNNAVPLASPTPAIRRTSAREAVYLLKCDNGTAGEKDELDHEERERWLTLISKNKLNIGVDPPPPKSTEIVPEVLVPDDDELSKDSLKGFI